jgi:hypothetical protein
MKGIIKKISVFVMIIAIAMFTVVATASAGGHHVRNGIKGTYAGTGNTQCTMSMGGFNSDFTIIGDNWSVSTNTMLANYTFNLDCTGYLEGTVRMMSLPGGTNSKPSGSYTESASYHFTYTVTDQGLITFTVVPGTFIVGYNKDINKFLCFDSLPKHGIISEDRKNIVIECGPPYLLNMVFCDDPLQKPIGPVNMCVTSAVLIKVQGEVDLTY